MEKQETYPPFCPTHQEESPVNCKRHQTCEECKREHLDLNIDPPHSNGPFDPGG
jgi:hypothetical protein